MNLAQEIIDRQTQVNDAVKKSSNDFLFRILSNPKSFDFDIVQAALMEWEIRKE